MLSKYIFSAPHPPTFFLLHLHWWEEREPHSQPIGMKGWRKGKVWELGLVGLGILSVPASWRQALQWGVVSSHTVSGQTARRWSLMLLREEQEVVDAMALWRTMAPSKRYWLAPAGTYRLTISTFFFFIFLREARNGNFSVKSSDFAMLRPNTKSLLTLSILTVQPT